MSQWGRVDGSKRRKVKRERDGISRAVGKEKEEGKRRKGRKKMEAKLVARWRRGDGGKIIAKRGFCMDFGGFSDGPGIKQGQSP